MTIPDKDAKKIYPNDYLEIYPHTTESGEIIPNEFCCLMRNGSAYNVVYLDIDGMNLLRDGINELLGETK